MVLRLDRVLFGRNFGGGREEVIDEAIGERRSTPRGEGHAAYFQLALALQRADLDDAAIQRKLREEAAYANSPKERRAEIEGILSTLRKGGSF